MTDLELICNLVSDFRSLSLTEIARTICELLEWKRPNGRLKNHECRLLLEKLSVAGLVDLPPLRVSGPRGPRRVLACLLWSSPAWKMAPRDGWIGWTNEERARNLQFVVNNSRFLILPWVRVRYLARTILSLCARQLPANWERLYGYRPLLLETLVGPQFRGTSYEAANWTYLGETRGRGRMDHHHEAHGRSVKRIYVYPLCRDVQYRLAQSCGAALGSCGKRRDSRLIAILGKAEQ